jgi:hypothetical protein
VYLPFRLSALRVVAMLGNPVGLVGAGAAAEAARRTAVGGRRSTPRAEECLEQVAGEEVDAGGLVGARLGLLGVRLEGVEAQTRVPLSGGKDELDGIGSPASRTGR